MSEGGAAASAAHPQVFVVDSQAGFIHIPRERSTRWPRDGQRLLLLLVGVSLLGLLVEGALICNLYQRTQASPRCAPDGICRNSSTLSSPNQQPGFSSQVGSRESNDIPPLPTHDRQTPFAHLLGPDHVTNESQVVQWVKDDEQSARHMLYDQGRLTVTQEGHYYIYTKVQMDVGEPCALHLHKVMKKTMAYGDDIELMKSKSYRCPESSHPKPKPKPESVDFVEMWNSFLAGTFHLLEGDQVFVTINPKEKMRPGSSENFMGAFMVFG